MDAEALALAGSLQEDAETLSGIRCGFFLAPLS